MRAYMSPPSKSLDATPRPSPIVLDQFRFVASPFFDGCAAVCIYPLLYFHGSCAVIKFVGYVCGLSGDVPDLADKGYLEAPGGRGMSAQFLLKRTGSKDTWVISASSMEKSASGWGWEALRTCIMVTGRRVSLPNCWRRHQRSKRQAGFKIDYPSCSASLATLL